MSRVGADAVSPPRDPLSQAESLSWPSPRRAWYVAAVLAFAYTVSFIDRVVISLLIEPIKSDLSLTDTEASLLIGFSFILFYVLLGFPIGRLADRWNRRNIIISGVV